MLPSIVISSPERSSTVAEAGDAALDVQLGGADHGGDAPAAGDDGGVADHAAASGEDALRRLHAEHVVGGGLGADEDDVLAAVAGLHRLVGRHRDAPARGAGRGRQAGGERCRVDAGGEAGVEELLEVVGSDGVDRRGDRGPRTDLGSLPDGSADLACKIPGQVPTHGARNVVSVERSLYIDVPERGTRRAATDVLCTWAGVPSTGGTGSTVASPDLLEVGLHVAAEQVHGALGLVEGHVAGGDLQHDVVGHARLEDAAEALLDLLGGARTGLDRLVDVAEDAAERAERGIGRILTEHLGVPPVHGVGAAHQAVHAAAGDVERAVFASSIASSIVQRDAGLRVGPVHADLVVAVRVPRVDVELVRLVVDRAGPDEVEAEPAGGDRAARVPERDVLLHRHGRHRHGAEVVVLRALGADLAGLERAADDAEHVLEAIGRLGPVAAEPVVLDRGDAAADAELHAAVGEVVGDAEVLDQAHRVVQREQLHHRPHADVRR